MPPSIIMRTQYENISEAEIDGIEGEVGYSFNNNWQVKATYTYLDARDKSDNSFLNGRAKHNGTVQLVYSDNKPNPLTATLWSQWYVDYLSRTTNNSITYDNEYTYNTLNFIVNKQFTKNFRAYAGVDNIFDKTFNIDDNHAYDIDGRTWRLGAEWTF
jgi:tonB-dependent outer membrane receptor for fe3+/colicin I